MEDWPGFRQVFRTNLEFPTKADSPLVQIVSEQTATDTLKSNKPEVVFLELLKNHARVLVPQRHTFDVLLIYIPSRWKGFRERKALDYYFDLHDALKVFCAPNNIVIQIVEEKALNYSDQMRVMWWLALALYVKGNRILWKLAEPVEDTAGCGKRLEKLNIIKLILESRYSEEDRHFVSEQYRKPNYGRNDY